MRVIGGGLPARPGPDGPRRTAVLRVRELEQVDEDAFPTAKVYGDTTRPELRLITCGGELLDGHRPDDIILYADLVAVRAA
ncbi:MULTISPECIES: hypothetical protein [unclassified Streptomyces]|uniref:hypothetical protein n=1 Tax=unclassified Streptomyces TaxID=2593676 RepID=UPI003806019E